MSKYIALLIFLLLGCNTEKEQRRFDKNTQDTGNRFLSKTCINGVTYYAGRHTLTPAYNTDGTLKLCRVNNNGQ